MDPSVFDGVTGQILKDVSELDMLLIQKGASRCSLLLGHWVTGPVIFIELSCRMPAEIWSKSFGVSLLSLWSVCGLPILPIIMTLVSLGALCGLPVFSHTHGSGHSVVFLRAPYGLFVVSTWSLCGLPLFVPFVMHFLRQQHEMGSLFTSPWSLLAMGLQGCEARVLTLPLPPALIRFRMP